MAMRWLWSSSYTINIEYMIKFDKEVEQFLPYNRKKYKSGKGWFGVSFQLPGVFEGVDIGLEKYLESYENWFKNIISKLDNDSLWVVNHDIIDNHWFPNEENNLNNLRVLFKQNNISNSFVGALLFTTDDLLKFAKDLISYPYAVINKKGHLYANLDISIKEQPFVIKISGHLCIDILSTNKEFLRQIVRENSSSIFIVRNYNNTLF